VVQSQPRKIVHEILSWKFPSQKRAVRGAQAVECLLNKREALSSNPNAAAPPPHTKKPETDWKEVSYNMRQLIENN
jgi:hypothetical protein